VAEQLPHFLVVADADGEREWEVEHDPNCPYEEQSSFLDPPGTFVRHYTCAIGEQVFWAGADAFVGGIPDPGRYPIYAEFSHTPSTPNGPAEWDAWIEVGDRIEAE